MFVHHMRHGKPGIIDAPMRLLTFFTALVLTACSVTPTSSPPPSSVQATTDWDRVEYLLNRAEEAFKKDQLDAPTNDNAYAWYLRVLEIAPGEPVATYGLERIVERYIERAMDAIAREAWITARTELRFAEHIDPNSAGILVLRRQIKMLEKAKRWSLTLPADDVRLRSRFASLKLKNFSATARTSNARVMIRAGSDADGRWMYEQLNDGPGNRRIRGEIEIGLPPQVRVVVMPLEDRSAG
ncbi:MAG: hypothetical protein VX266_05775 [Pseudomonadota bacterium]|nr:hypothetical protein [Pseudomonadota bacterium]